MRSRAVIAVMVLIGSFLTPAAYAQIGQGRLAGTVTDAQGAVMPGVTVTGTSPVVDVTTTKVGTDLKGEALTAVPNSTDAWGALSEAPGVRMQGFDVGGSHKSQQSGYEVFGIQNQSRIVTDGVDHTEGVGGTGFYEDY